MWDLLANLNQSFPCVLCSEFGAVWALPVLHEILDLEYLLKDRRSEDFFLDRERDAESF